MGAVSIIATWVVVGLGLAVLFMLALSAWAVALNRLANAYRLNRAFLEFCVERRRKHQESIRRNCVPVKDQPTPAAGKEGSR